MTTIRLAYDGIDMLKASDLKRGIIKIKYLFYLFIFLLTTCFLSCVAKPTSFDLRTGDYLCLDYINNLKQFKSPIKAHVKGSPQSLKVSHVGVNTIISPIFDFNEGGESFIVSPNENVIQKGGLSQKFTVLIVDTCHLKLGFGNFRVCTYVFVDTAEKYAAKICLEGSYYDSINNHIKFNTNGTVLFNNDTLNYKIGLFYYPDFSYDYFSTKSEEFGFRRTFDSLYIYKSTGGSIFESGDIDPKEIFLLKKMQP